MTKREIEIVRRFKAGESVEDLSAPKQRGTKIDFDDNNNRIVVPLMYPAAFEPFEVNAALRKAVHAVPKDLWDHWTGVRTHGADAETCELCREDK